ncbi:MAG: FKBP-type peptidyl-prolyl cis-trans isomerase [Planctomycetota bacterium]
MTLTSCANGPDGQAAGDNAAATAATGAATTTPPTAGTSAPTAPAAPAAPSAPPPAATPANPPSFRLPSDAELTTTASGLQYQILRQGSGAAPLPTQKVTVHYCGWLTNGQKFDSSFDRGQPINWSVSRFIQGWIEGLQLIQPGGAILLVVPGNLAYPNGGPGTPGSTLVFHIELLAVT